MYVKQAVLALCLIVPPSVLLTFTAQAQERIDRVIGESAQFGPSECTAQVRQCQDGSFVSRDPSNGCEFFPCPEVCVNPITGDPDLPVLCFVNPCEVSLCEADPDASCAPNYCGGCHAIYTDAEGQPAQCDPVVCTDDVRQCPDGSFVSRDPSNGCEFLPCPEVCINPITGNPDFPVLCLANPCEVSSCEADPDASCAPNFCGGCHAIYTDAEGQPALCEPVPEPSSLALQFFAVATLAGIGRARRRRG